jgi:hypothetical protein
MVWHDTIEKRFYTIEQIGPPDSILLDPEKVVIAHGQKSTPTQAAIDFDPDPQCPAP